MLDCIKEANAFVQHQIYDWDTPWECATHYYTNNNLSAKPSTVTYDGLSLESVFGGLRLKFARLRPKNLQKKYAISTYSTAVLRSPYKKKETGKGRLKRAKLKRENVNTTKLKRALNIPDQKEMR